MRNLIDNYDWTCRGNVYVALIAILVVGLLSAAAVGIN